MTSTPMRSSNAVVASDRRSGKAGRMRGAASITLTFRSLLGSTRSKPYETTSRVVRYNSAASSTPVAPAPIMATCNWSGAKGLVCACARIMALSILVWKCFASFWDSKRRANCSTPGVAKSLLRLPMERISVSYGTVRCGVISIPWSSQ